MASLHQAGADLQGGQPLSFAQQRFWLLHELSPESPEYNLAQHVRIQGPLNVAALRAALAALVERHQVLRTTIEAGDDGEPLQFVQPFTGLDVPLVDVRAVAGSEDETQALTRLVDAAWRLPFDLRRDRMLRCVLLRIDDEDHHLVATFHHVAADHWSIDVFWRELSALYAAFMTGRTSPLPALRRQYADYARQQRRFATAQSAKSQFDFWRRQLTGLAPLHFPGEPAVLERLPSSGNVCQAAISPDLADNLAVLAHRFRVTRFALLLAVLKTLVMRYTGQTDIAVGVPVATRPLTDFDPLLGCYLNSVVVRTEMSRAGDGTGSLSFVEVLERVWRSTQDALSNQDIPLEQIIPEIASSRRSGLAQVYRVTFNAVFAAASEPDLPGLVVSEVPIPAEYPKADVTLYLRPWRDQLRLRLVCHPGLFDQAQAAELLAQYVMLLEQVAADPARPVTDYSLVTPAARQVLPNLAETLDEPRFPTVIEIFQEWARQKPQAPAVRQRGHSWCYAELDVCSHAIAQALVSAGVRRGETVAVKGARSFGLIATMLGVLRAGGVVLTLDPDLPPWRKQRMMAISDARCLVTLEHDSERAPSGMAAIGAGVEAPCRLGVDPDTGAVLEPAGKSPGVSLPVLEGNDAAYVFFTSGTTAEPKGIRGNHKGLSHFLEWQRETFAIGPEDRIAQTTNLSFDPLLRDVFLPLTSGAILCLPDHDASIASGMALPWLESEGVTVLHVVPTLAGLWVREVPAGVRLPSLRWVFMAGEPLTSALVDQWRHLFTQRAPDRRPPAIVNLYGPTETTMVKCFYVVPDEIRPGIQPLGRALPNTQALVLGLSLRLCGIGEPGEIAIRTPFRTQGYLNAPGETRSRFVSNPCGHDPDDMLYRTGDRGRLRPDGVLDFLGRQDDQVKIRGVRIEPAEVAATIAAHPAVGDCYVDVRQDEDAGSYLAAFVVPLAAGASRSAGEAPAQIELDVAAVWSYLRQRLPAVMVPAAAAILPELPRTANGKVNRALLPDPASVGALTGPADGELGVPRTDTEAVLLAIWREVLHHDALSIDQNFFDLGGHSLSAAAIVARTRIVFDVHVPLWTIFDYPTVAEMAAAIDALQDMAPSE